MFKFLILSVVKIGKQCLQTASASGRLRSLDPLTPLVPDTLGYPQIKIPVVAIERKSFVTSLTFALHVIYSRPPANERIWLRTLIYSIFCSRDLDLGPMILTYEHNA